ncbi:MAG TPA: hypothetical protein VLG50_04920 [Candidatus Saccharimonadales bacterium]|nr:hypothetical protein [Candidatus Saccharimonadales bacterium]
MSYNQLRRYDNVDRICDILTYYDVLLRRYNCISIDSHYAKTQTLKILDCTYQNYTKSIVTTYIYLMMNQHVMNIAYPSSLYT